MTDAEIAVDEQVDVLSFLGDIAMAGDKPKLHAHVVLGRHDGTTCGGHLLDGQVWPTLELSSPRRRPTSDGATTRRRAWPSSTWSTGFRGM